MKQEPKKTSLTLDPELYRRVRIRAAEEGIKVRDILEDALRAYLDRKGGRHSSR